MFRASFIISFILLFWACSETQNPEINVGNRSGNLGGMYYDEESESDSLVLPNQTTGSFLTMFCKWENRGSATADASALCRIEDDATKTKYRGPVSWDVFYEGTSIFRGAEAINYSDGPFSSRVKFAPQSKPLVEIRATFDDIGKSMTVKPSMFDFNLFPALITGEPVKFARDDTNWGRLADSLLDGFLNPAAFCDYSGLYNRNSSGVPFVDYTMVSGIKGMLGGTCGSGGGTLADIGSAIINGGESKTDFTAVCSYHKQPIQTNAIAPIAGSRYCKLQDELKTLPGTKACGALSVVEINTYVKAHSERSDEIDMTVLVFANQEMKKGIEKGLYIDKQGILMGIREIEAYINTIPSCSSIVN